MKKLFIYASIIGVSAGVVYWLYKKEKSNTGTSGTEDKKENSEPDPQEEEASANVNTEEKIHQVECESTKRESTENVNERHARAGAIMKDAYSNIMEDFVEDFSDEKDVNAKDEMKEVDIDGEAVSVMKEMDSLSDELDDLLK